MPIPISSAHSAEKGSVGAAGSGAGCSGALCASGCTALTGTILVSGG